MDTVINGHSPVTMKFQDLADFGEFNRLFLEHARASLKAGKTPEQAMMDLKLPDKFKDYNLTGGRGGPGGNFGVIFEELKVNNAKVFAIFVVPPTHQPGPSGGPASRNIMSVVRFTEEDSVTPLHLDCFRAPS